MKHETIRACSIWRALEVVGDVPVLLILEQAFLGRHQFDEFVKATGIARSVVSNRLQKLVETGVFIKVAERRGGYRLTEKGLGLFPMALMVLRWQYLWESKDSGTGVSIVHRTCGNAMIARAACAHCSTNIDPRNVSWRPGPGLSQVTPAYGRRRMQTSGASAKRAKRAMGGVVVDLFGDRWATLIIRACFTNIHRFDDIQRDTLMASNILADRLERLQANGVIWAKPYSTYQDRFEYRLTEKGRDFYPVLLALLQWGDHYYADKAGPPLLLTHNDCNHSLCLAPKCSVCDGLLDSRNTSFAFAQPS